MIMKAINFDPTNHSIIAMIPCCYADGCFTLELEITDRSLPLRFEVP